mmetsp:Transcript_55940/g.89033  ORF Transcript_55940/g.89033 Transcript_55940/m.89033 type:complete len:231 (+) Transcript_55940:687-1379(+)
MRTRLRQVHLVQLIFILIGIRWLEHHCPSKFFKIDGSVHIEVHFVDDLHDFVSFEPFKYGQQVVGGDQSIFIHIEFFVLSLDEMIGGEQLGHIGVVPVVFGNGFVFITRNVFDDSLGFHFSLRRIDTTLDQKGLQLLKVQLLVVLEVEVKELCLVLFAVLPVEIGGHRLHDELFQLVGGAEGGQVLQHLLAHRVDRLSSDPGMLECLRCAQSFIRRLLQQREYEILAFVG